MRFSDEFIEEVKARNDIADVVGSYIPLKKKGIITGDCARSIMRRQLPFPSILPNRCITASDAAREAMS